MFCLGEEALVSILRSAVAVVAHEHGVLHRDQDIVHAVEIMSVIVEVTSLSLFGGTSK